MDMRIKELVRAAVFISLAVCIAGFLSMGFVNDKASYTRLMINEMYNEEHIDLLFLGASHVYRGIVPECVEEKLNLSVYNAGSSNQFPEDSFFLLKEILNRKKTVSVVYDINYAMFQNYPEDSSIRTHILLDYFKPGWNKADYALNVLENPFYASLCYSNFMRFKETWKKPRQVAENLYTHLFDRRYKCLDYGYADKDIERYAGKGFVYSYQEMKENNYAFIPWDESTINWEQVNYLDKIIDLCRERGVNLYFISIPVYSGHLVKEPRYNEIHNFFTQKARNEGITYIDFNLDEECSLKSDSSMYMDASHLNGKGAEAFSEYLCGYAGKKSLRFTEENNRRK